MPSRSPPSTPHSDVDHPHLVYYSPLSDSPEQSMVTVPDSPTHLDKNTQTSTEHIIVQNVSIQTLPNPPLTLQQREPPNLSILLQLRDLLKDPKLFTPMMAHCDVHSPILNLYKSFCQTINLEPYQEIENVKIPTIWHHTCPLPAQHTSLPHSSQRCLNKTWQKNLLHPMLSPWTFLKGLSFLPMPLLPPNTTKA